MIRDLIAANLGIEPGDFEYAPFSQHGGLGKVHQHVRRQVECNDRRIERDVGGMIKLETGLHYPLKLDALSATWRIGHVGDFAEEIQPGFASGKHNKEGAGIPHIRPYNIDRRGKLDLTEIKSVAPDSDAKRLRTGDVLFNNTNSPELIGKTTIIASAGDWGFSNHMTRIRFKDDVAPKFAAYQLHFLWMTGYYLHNCVKHVNQASISSKTLASVVPFIAPPLDQQKRIVAEIEKQFSRLDEAVANLKRVKANLKRYKAAVLKAAVEGRLVETEAELSRRQGRSYETGEQLLQRILESRRSQCIGKGKHKEPASPDTAGLPELPGGWVWASADQVMALITDGEHITPQRSGSGVLLLSARNVLNGRLDLTEVDFIPDDEHERLCKRLTIAEGDVLLSCSGSVGRTCVVPPAVKFSLVRSVAVLRPALISSEFVCYQIQSPWLQSQIKSKQTQTAQANIFQGKIRQLTFALPPEAEQDRIVAEVDRRLSLLREIEAQVDVNLRRAERLRQSILQQAFAGGLMGMSREKLCA